MKQTVTVGRRATEAAKPTSSNHALAEQVVNRIALLMGEIHQDCKTNIQLNPEDRELLSAHISDQTDLLLGCLVIENSMLRPGTCVIEGLGKKELYFHV
jgi:hypothetical protein